MTSTLKNNMYEIKSSTYPSDSKVIQCIENGEIYGSLIYVNSALYSPDNYTEIDKPPEEIIPEQE